MHMDLKNKRVLVVGSGISGIAAAKLLDKKQAKVLLFDSNVSITKEQIQEKLQEKMQVEIIIGRLTQQQKESIDLVVLSPGVPTDLELVNELRNQSIPIWGEIELAYICGKGDVIAITGTNGKTTTTALVGEIMKTYYDSVYVVGNIGMPYTNIALETTEESVVVAEISSFQLETVHTFRPKVSAILNITPDHLNRHHTMEAYIQAKWNITRTQTKEDVCVLNYEDETLRNLSSKLQANIVWFSSKRELEKGIYLDESHNIIYSEASNKKGISICHVSELKLIGIHNYENVMAAIAIAIAMNVPMDCIRKAIKAFKAVEHRIEYVAEKKGVTYYNDSKGTNPDAAMKAIQAMNTKTVLIGGGYDKDSDYIEWIQAFDGKVTYFVLVGQTKEKIESAAKKCGFFNCILVDTFEEAVEISAKKAKPGEAVLLSPACASWGMFRDYQERGNVFKELVYKMED